MSEEKKQNIVESEDLETEKVLKDEKKKGSKRWRKKSSKGELSSAQKEFLDRGKQKSDLGDEECKGKAKEKKSFKGRIRKISLRKLSKTEKKNVMDQGQTSFDAEGEVNQDTGNQQNEKQEYATEIAGEVDKKKNYDLQKGDIEASAEVQEDENCGSNEETDQITSLLPVDDDREEESHFETSTEVSNREDMERRKSKDDFAAVIVELANKDHGLGNNNDNATTEISTNEKLVENGATEKEAIAPEECNTETNDLAVETYIENAGRNEEDKLLSDIEEERTERKETSFNDNEMEAEDKNEDEANDPKTFRPLKDENLDISQKIAKKAMGKVVGRYRQVQLTKTYCACCSVM
eukprot:gene15555-6820_t